MRNVPVQIMNAVDTSTQTGAAFETQQIYAASFCPIFGDATAAGTVTLPASPATGRKWNAPTSSANYSLSYMTTPNF